MGKAKRREKKAASVRHRKKVITKPNKILKAPAGMKKVVTASKKGINSSQSKAQIPFTRDDRVLLVGEGDFSFALSLAKHHPPAHITATSYDSEADLFTKYPHARHNIDELLLLSAPSSSPSPSSSSPTSSGPKLSPSPSPPIPITTPTTPPPPSTTISIHHSISALTLYRHRPLRRHGPYTKIVFNFPHVGGRSTDVNRQVRANQELLVGFFHACRPLLATSEDQGQHQHQHRQPPPHHRPADDNDNDNTAITDNSGAVSRAETNGPGPGPGLILLTLFTREPYTLWNVRDLARHAGLRVRTSFRFPWAAWPGYRHARTLGEIRGKPERKGQGTDGREDGVGRELEREKGGGRQDGKRAGAWRGEEREARCFVFCDGDGEGEGQGQVVDVSAGRVGGGRGKRKNRDDSDDDDDDKD